MDLGRVVAFATQGDESGDADRLRALIEGIPHSWFRVGRGGAGARARLALSLLRELRERKPALVVMEGTGIGGGLPLILGRILYGTRFVVSSGDAVGPFVWSQSRAAGPLFSLYERALMRACAGFVGWTPYLVGRALTLGAPRAVSVPGWAARSLSSEEWATLRRQTRGELAVAEGDMVLGIAGTIKWTAGADYCYGLELVAALKAVDRPDRHVLVVGDGDGLPHLVRLAGGDPRVHFVGRVAAEEVPRYLAAMDVGSIPQSVDGVGLFRYSTKLAEYVASRLPVVTGPIPMGYDLDGGWIWRLNAGHPWSPAYVAAMSQFMREVSPAAVDAARGRMPGTPTGGDADAQRARMHAFLSDVAGPA